MTKRLLISVLAVILTFSILPIFSQKTDAAEINASYNRENALQYASKHWNDGKGLCAEFVADCLRAGGLTETYRTRVKPLFDALLEANNGVLYELKLTDNSIHRSYNDGKLDAGDPIFYRCNVCGDFTHVSLCNGFNSEGYAVEYSHNNPHNGYKRTYTYNHCGSNSWTFYSIKMYDVNTVFGEKTEIDPPRISNITNANGGVTVSWNKVENATYYRVYRKTAGTSWLFLNNVTGLSYTDTTAENGVEYTYVVRACKGSVFSAYYPGVSITYLSTVKFVSATNASNAITVKWNQNPQADGYYLYRRVNNGYWYRISNINGSATTTYIDRDVIEGNTYRYRIRAAKGTEFSSYEVAGIGTKCLTAPVLTKIANDEAGIRVDWNSCSGAEGYRVYRRASGERYWTYLETVSTNYFVDENVKSGTYYRYTVRSVSGNIYGSYNPVGLLIRCVATPEMTGASYTENGVQLTWRAVEGARGYYVYHKAENAPYWRRIAVLGNDTSFVDTLPSKDSTYNYTVKAFYGYTMSSYYKDGLKCICDASKGIQTTDAPTTPPETTVSEMLTEFNNAVTISKQTREPITLSVTNLFLD